MNKDIYEIYRACRLCGVGAGYKMPIIQSIIDLHDQEIELKQKIRECLQIEVNLNDRMPPLICELCVDKLQDFYDFRKMCQDTNKKTRMKLGLPFKAPQCSSEADRILGVTESLNSDSDEGQPLVRHQARKPAKTSKIKESDVKIKVEDKSILIESRSPTPERRETRQKRAPSPKRLTRQNRPDNLTLAELQDFQTPKPSLRSRPGPKSVLRSRERQQEVEKETLDQFQIEDNPLLVPKQKRPREVLLEAMLDAKRTRLSSDPTNKEPISKPGPKSSKEPKQKAGPKSRVREPSPMLKTAPKSRKPEISKSKRSDSSSGPTSKTKVSTLTIKNNIIIYQKPDDSSPGPKSRKQPEASKAPEKASLECIVCGFKTKAAPGLSSHMKVHMPTFTLPKLACNACELWFPNADLATTHHQRHKAGLPYSCAKCYDDFKTAEDFELHFVRNQCLTNYEVPDVKCEECWRMFATYKLLEEHKCAGQGARPGGKCPKCRRTYTSLKSLTLHEMRCTAKRKVQPEPEPEPTSSDIARDMLPMRVRIARCDALLAAGGGTCGVAGLGPEFGLDRSCTYPYLLTGLVKSEPATTPDHMVDINDDIKQEYSNQDFDNDETENNDDVVPWDSDNDSDGNLSTSSKSVNSLSTISLKKLFSPQCLGKVPRKKRKAKSGEASNSLLEVDYNEDTKSNINSIIDSLLKESINNDSYDSFSISDKTQRKDDGVDVFDSLRNLENATNESRGINKPDEETNRSENDDIISNSDENSDTTDLTKIATNETKESIANSENERIIKLRDENIEVTSNSPTIFDVNKSESTQKFSDDNKGTENNEVNSELLDNISQNSDNSRSSSKNGHVVSNKIVNEEPLTIEDKVENRKAQIELENMDVEEKESEPNSEDISNLVGSSNVEMIEQSENPTNNSDDEDDTNLDSKSSETSRVVNGETNDNHDSFSAVNDERNINDDSSCATNDKENDNDASYYKTDDKMNDDDVLSCATDDKTNDNSNETNLSSVKNDATNHSEATCFSQNNLIDTEFSFPKNEVKHQDREIELNSGESKDSLITENQFENKNVHKLDKFNINHLDEEDKLLMAELDAQIGENSNTAGENINTADENSNTAGENSNTAGENSNTAGENSENSRVIGENRVNESVNLSSEYCPIGLTNKGFTEQENENFGGLVEQDNLKSLDLDSISDEEFNFDI